MPQPPHAPKTLAELINLTRLGLDDNAYNTRLFYSKAHDFLKRLAKDLGLKFGEYLLYSNRDGAAAGGVDSMIALQASELVVEIHLTEDIDNQVGYRQKSKSENVTCRLVEVKENYTNYIGHFKELAGFTSGEDIPIGDEDYAPILSET